MFEHCSHARCVEDENKDKLVIFFKNVLKAAAGDSVYSAPETGTSGSWISLLEWVK